MNAKDARTILKKEPTDSGEMRSHWEAWLYLEALKGTDIQRLLKNIRELAQYPSRDQAIFLILQEIEEFETDIGSDVSPK